MKKSSSYASAAALLIAVIIVVSMISNDDAESKPEGPTQPILFIHKIHAGENQIPCQYCHSYAAISAKPGIPSVQKCMGCPASAQITAESKYLIEELEGVSEATIEIVWDPPWDPSRMSEEAKQSMGYD